MEVAALITWVITALGGFVLLGTWISRGGTRQGGDAAASRFPPGLIFGHFLLAATGLVLWIIYLVADSSVLASRSSSATCTSTRSTSITRTGRPSTSRSSSS